MSLVDSQASQTRRQRRRLIRVVAVPAATNLQTPDRARPDPLRKVGLRRVEIGRRSSRLTDRARCARYGWRAGAGCRRTERIRRRRGSRQRSGRRRHRALAVVGRPRGQERVADCARRREPTQTMAGRLTGPPRLQTPCSLLLTVRQICRSGNRDRTPTTALLGVLNGVRQSVEVRTASRRFDLVALRRRLYDE